MTTAQVRLTPLPAAEWEWQIWHRPASSRLGWSVTTATVFGTSTPPQSLVDMLRDERVDRPNDEHVLVRRPRHTWQIVDGAL